jgi:hypothetical protein
MNRWVALWDRRETAESIAFVRILVPLVIAWDLLDVLRLGLTIPLWGPIEEGGLGPTSYAAPICWAYRWLGVSSTSTWILFAITLIAAISLSLGFMSRTSAVILLLAYAQLAQLSPDADRGIDRLLRNVLCILPLAAPGTTLSLDARLRTGRWVSDQMVWAWPRLLIIAQLVLLYFFAGILKQAAGWSYSGGYTALFQVMQKPHLVKYDLPPALAAPIFPLLQIGTFSTVTWERSAPLLPILLWLRETRARPGKFRALVNRARLLELWVALGAFFHLSLAVFFALGAFPWGCLALYPALAKPSTWRAWAARLRRQ